MKNILTILSLSAIAAIAEGGDFTGSFSNAYDPSDQFFNFRFHIHAGGKEVFKSARIPGVFSPDQKLTVKFEPRFEKMDINGDKLMDFVLILPRADAMVEGVQVAVIAQKPGGTFAGLLTKDDEEEVDFLTQNDYQGGLLISNSGFHRENVKIKGNAIELADKSGRLHTFEVRDNRLMFKESKVLVGKSVEEDSSK